MDFLPGIIRFFTDNITAITGGLLAIYLYRRYKNKKENES